MTLTANDFHALADDKDARLLGYLDRGGERADGIAVMLLRQIADCRRKAYALEA